jgi:hypothetical protein
LAELIVANSTEHGRGDAQSAKSNGGVENGASSMRDKSHRPILCGQGDHVNQGFTAAKDHVDISLSI